MRVCTAHVVFGFAVRLSFPALSPATSKALTIGGEIAALVVAVAATGHAVVRIALAKARQIVLVVAARGGSKREGDMNCRRSLLPHLPLST